MHKNKLRLTLCPSTQEDVRAFVQWRYESPFDIYNLHPDGDSDQKDLEKIIRYFLDPACACHSISDQYGNLVGFCTFGQDGQVPGGDYDADALDIGMCVHPAWTGRGYGITFVNAVLDLAIQRFHPVAFRVTVAKFNRRALRVWQKAGFAPVQSFVFTENNQAFVVLIRAVNNI